MTTHKLEKRYIFFFAEFLLPNAAEELLFTDLLCFHKIICLYAYYINTEVTVIL